MRGATCARARYRYGLVLKKTGRLEEAKREFLTSLSVNPLNQTILPDHSKDAAIELVDVYKALGETDRAEALSGSVINDVKSR